MSPFSRNLAVIIGINDYRNGIPTLGTAINDAKEISKILREEHDYQAWILLDKVATLENIKTLLTETLPQQVTADDRLLFYFAGHGIALNGEDGPEGYLIPQDAKLGDTQTYLPMTELQSALLQLPCRHFLGLLDCCFAGAFRWSSTRDIGVIPEVIYQERYDRFIIDPAWQIITSAASDQKAADVFNFQTKRGQNGNYSPFATALMDALTGKADTYPPSVDGKPAGDGVITASELYLYLRDTVETASDPHKRQTPGIWPLKKHDKGEYIFLSPKHPLNLPPAPPLDVLKNPYRGLESFEEEHSNLFFGRTATIKKLYEFVNTHTLTVVLGASGTGKSSLVKAGLISYLKEQSNLDNWYILTPFRPGESPLKALHKTLALEKGSENSITYLGIQEKITTVSSYLDSFIQQHPHHKLLIVIDQLEELMTLCKDVTERENFLNLLTQLIATYPQQLRMIITLRSDFEPQFQESSLQNYWQNSRFLVSPMTRNELREAIEKPAEQRVMYFQPYNLVEQLIDEVADMPGTLPLLSFGLSELYLKYLQRQREAENAGETIDRALTQADYQALGGVMTSLTKRADEEYEKLVRKNTAYAQVIRHLMLRMVSMGGGELARRRVQLSELEYPTRKNALVKEVIERFTTARLLVTGEDAEGNPYVEPAHDVLVRGWQKLLMWKQEDEESIILQRRLTPAAQEWRFQQQPRFLWHTNPRLNLLKTVAKSDDNWLNWVEGEFVHRSIARKTFNTRRNWTVAIAVMLGLSAGLLFSLIGYRNTLINQAIASQSSAKNNLRLNHSLDGMIDSLQAGQTLKHPLVQFPLFKLFRPTDTIQEEIQGTLQWAVYRVKEANRMLGNNSVIVRSVVSPYDAEKQMIASAGEDGSIKLWNLQGKLLKSWNVQLYDNQPNQRIWNVTFNPKGNLLASSGEDGMVRLWNLEEILKLPEVELQKTPKHQIIKAYQGYDQGYVRYVDFSRDGKYLAILEGEGGNGYMGLWNLQGDRLAFWKADNNTPPVIFTKTVDFYPNNNQDIIITIGMDKKVKIWDIKNIKSSNKPKLLSTLLIPKSENSNPSNTTDNFKGWGAFFSPNGKHIVAAGDEGDIALWTTSEKGLWNSQNQKVGKVWQAHEDTIWNIAFSPDSQKIVSGGEDGNVRVWNLKGEQIAKFEGHNGPVRSVKFTADSQQVVSSGDDGTTRLWNLPEQLLNNQKIESYPNSRIENKQDIISPDNQLRAFIDQDNKIQVTNMNGTELNTFQDHIGKVSAINFSPNSKLLVSAGQDNTIRVWKDLEKKKQGRYSSIFQAYEQESENYTYDEAKIIAVVFSPDNQKIIAGDNAGYIRIWDLKQNQKIAMWQVSNHAIETLNFSSEGDLLVSFVDQENIVKLSLESFNQLVERGCHNVKNFLENNSNFSSMNSSLCKKTMKNKQLIIIE